MKPIKQEKSRYINRRAREIHTLTVFGVPKVATALDPFQIPVTSEAFMGAVEANAESRIAQPPS